MNRALGPEAGLRRRTFVGPALHPSDDMGTVCPGERLRVAFAASVATGTSDFLAMYNTGRASTFTATERLKTALHEAGHAIAYSLAGFGVERVEIADEGVSFAELNYWGLCKPCVKGLYIVGLKWDDNAGQFVIDRNAHLSHVRRLEGQFARRLRRHMRASVCARLAGQLAEQWMHGPNALMGLEEIVAADVSAENLCAMTQDREFEIEEAQAICSLLPSRHAYEHALQATARALLDHWHYVEHIAFELQRLGKLEGDTLASLLPPARRHWPPAQVVR